MARKKNELILSDTKKDKKIDFDKVKEELTDYIDLKIKKEINEEIEKANKRVLREKNKKILFRNIVIIVLLLIIAFLLYLLNSVGYFKRFFTDDKQDIKTEEIIKDKSQEEIVSVEVKKKTLDELKKEYAHYLDNYYISEKSIYLDDYYNGNLTAELKNYLALNLVNFNLLKQEEDYNIIDANALKDTYQRIFDDEYRNNTFDYHNNKVRFINSLNAYVTEKMLSKDSSNIKREILEIEEKDQEVIIKTIEGIVEGNQLFNIKNEEIAEYRGDSLLNYQDRLNKMVYIFENGKLIKIVK